MSSRYGIMGILLFIIVLILAYENYEIWSSPSGAKSSRDGGRKEEVKAEVPVPAPSPREPAPREAFNVIAEKNAFSPERKEFSATAAYAGGPGGAGGKPVTRPQITLYGVVLGENVQLASIINPGRPLHKGERETKTLKVGERIGEYKLAQIMPDRIVMEGEDDSFEVLLFDPRAPKKRPEIRTVSKAPTAAPPQPGPPAQVLPVPPSVMAPGPTVEPPTPTPRARMIPPRTRIPRTAEAPSEGTYQDGGFEYVPDPTPARVRRPSVPTPAAPTPAPPG